MDIAWLEKNSFLDHNQVRDLIKDLDRRHFNSGQAWFGAAADLFSDLAPQSREYYWEELKRYASDNINFKIEYVQSEVDENLRKYACIAGNPEEAARQVFTQLWRLWGIFDYNPQCSAEFGESLSINAFYFEIRWILGQLLTTFPDLLEVSEDDFFEDELPEKYRALDKAYHVVEFLAKSLGDEHIQFFYSDMYPEALAAQLEAILERETSNR